MEHPTTLLGWAGFIGLGGLGFLFTITLVVFVHELGHFLTGRYFGVRVESFSIGFGRSIAGFKDKYGTHWKIGWLPLGGYVKFWGDEGVSSAPDHEKLDQASSEERARLFYFKPLWQKAIIAVGGPVANFLLALVILTSLYMFYGVGVVMPLIGRVAADSPAERAGLKVGDTIVSINNSEIKEFDDIVQIVSVQRGNPLPITVRRDGQLVSLTVTPQPIEKTDPLGNKAMDPGIGIGNVMPGEVKSVAPGSPAAAAGLQAGDIIFEVNGKRLHTLADVSDAIVANPSGSIALQVARMKDKAGEELTLRVVPVPIANPSLGVDELVSAALGFEVTVRGGPNPVAIVRFGPVEAAYRAFRQVRFIVVKTLDFIVQLLTGHGDYQQLSGPIGIAQVSGQVLVFFGVVALINLAAVLSVSIGLLNLFPIPMLDGGHLLYYGIEAVRGRPLGERAQELGFRIGLLMVVSLMLFATWNDLTKLF